MVTPPHQKEPVDVVWVYQMGEDLEPEPRQAREMMSLGFPPGELEEVAGETDTPVPRISGR